VSRSALELRRARILDAMVAVVAKRGFAATSVTAVCARAGVSRRTFYDCFDDLRACFLAVLDDGHRQVSVVIASAFSNPGDWTDGLRRALAELLLLFDRRPKHARVWLVESRAAGAWALERSAKHVEALMGQVLERWPAPPGAASHPLAATGVIESVLAITQTRAITAPGEPMVPLLGPLVGIVMAPYLDEGRVAVEIERASALARHLATARPPREAPSHPTGEMSVFLSDPRAHRARQVVTYVASNPGASNRQIADAVGIAGHTQMSKLLSRLARGGLIRKGPTRPGYPNSWSLTVNGQQHLALCTSHTSGTPVASRVTS
jgi:AcrR family transcriptional regulator